MIFFSCFHHCWQSMVSIVVIIIVVFEQSCSAKHRQSCVPSSCGKIGNISYPFRLKGDPRGCGLPKYELDCVNNVTVISTVYQVYMNYERKYNLQDMDYRGKYHVQEIDYKRYRIRLTDAGVVEDTDCSIPRYFLNLNSFEPYFGGDDRLTLLEGYFNLSITLFLNCSNPVIDDPRYVDVNAGGCHSGSHIYSFLFRYNEFTPKDIKVGCRLKVATFANWTYDRNVSYADIRKWLHEGFWLSWLSPVACRDHCGRESCFLNETTEQIQCRFDDTCLIFNTKPVNCGKLSRFLGYIKGKHAFSMLNFSILLFLF
ncbi:hypothetical protein Fmac_032010 [Flemingia macrophylla]|uniref:Wall-associated receptor kinase galacturonan-binding domain-containing protein n=1 Tax=Flemingia macrophylla TaxID=520843 RepID=A0ABD1L3P8_9FABA